MSRLHPLATMNRNTTLILVGVFAVLLLYVLLIQRPAEEAKANATATPGASTTGNVWGTLTADQVLSVRIEDRSAGRAVAFGRSSASAAWEVTEPEARPADQLTAATNVGTLVNLTDSGFPCRPFCLWNHFSILRLRGQAHRWHHCPDLHRSEDPGWEFVLCRQRRRRQCDDCVELFPGGAAEAVGRAALSAADCHAGPAGDPGLDADPLMPIGPLAGWVRRSGGLPARFLLRGRAVGWLVASL